MRRCWGRQLRFRAIAFLRSSSSSSCPPCLMHPPPRCSLLCQPRLQRSLNWRRCRRRWRRDEAGQARAFIGPAGLLASLQLLSPHHQGRKEIWLMPGCCQNRRIACCHSVLFAFALMSVQYRFLSCPRFVPYVSPHSTSQNTVSTRCCARHEWRRHVSSGGGGQKHANILFPCNS